MSIKTDEKTQIVAAEESIPTTEYADSTHILNTEQQQHFDNVAEDVDSVASRKEEADIPAKKNVKPNLARLLLRVWQVFAAIGAFGFQVGASPYSGESIPFEKPDLLYCSYAICWLSIFWSSFNIFVYLSRRFGNGNKIKRFVSTLFDFTFTALFGVCTFYQIATYKCKPGLHNGWCEFFNTGLFFLATLFTTYFIHALWDIFSTLTCLRTRGASE